MKFAVGQLWRIPHANILQADRRTTGKIYGQIQLAAQCFDIALQGRNFHVGAFFEPGSIFLINLAGQWLREPRVRRPCGSFHDFAAEFLHGVASNQGFTS